jgi:uncharacterized iron-regulated membrane protein
MFWGDHVQRWATQHNLSTPAPPAEVMPAWMLSATMPSATHARHEPHEIGPELPWALEQAPAPRSHDAHRADIGIDRAVARLEALGLPRPFSLQLPEGPRGAYVGTYTPDQVERVRTIYLDRTSGEVLSEVRFRDYGPAAKAIEWGIAVHEGRQYGWANRWVMLAGCIAVVLLAVTAVTMWWKRRPKGTLAPPPAPTENGAAIAVLAVVAIAGLVFPLVGVSLVAALIADASWRLLSRSAA